MSLPFKPNQPPSPRRERRRSHHQDSPRRRRPSDVESRPYYDIPPPISPTRRPKQEAYIGAVESPRTPVRSEREPMMNLNSPTGDLRRKRSLVRPERSRIDRDHPNYHYRQHAHNLPVQPSTTGNDPIIEDVEEVATQDSNERELEDAPGLGKELDSSRRKKHREKSKTRSDHHGRTRLHRKGAKELTEEERRRELALNAVRPPSLWNIYCRTITFWAPGAILSCFGMPSKAQQRAWREKMGLISIIVMICAFVGFITFGFTQAVCGQTVVNMEVNKVGRDHMIFHGAAYNLNNMRHPGAAGIPDGSNVLYDLPHKFGGQDGSFMFQQVNGACKGLITAAPGSPVPTDDNGNMAWYFPCNAFNQDGSSPPNLNDSSYYLGYACHTTLFARQAFYDHFKSSGDVSFSWADVKNTSRNLAVFSGNVLDLNLLNWLNMSEVRVIPQIEALKTNLAVQGTDLTHAFSSGQEKQIGECLSQVIRVGSVDTETVGCIASKVVLYVSLVFILSIVLAKFFLALAFQWFFSRKYAAPKSLLASNPVRRKKRAQAIEDWSNDIYRAPPKLSDTSSSSAHTKRGSVFLPSTSRFTSPYAADKIKTKNRPAPTTMASQSSTARLVAPGPIYKDDTDSIPLGSGASASATSLTYGHGRTQSSTSEGGMGSAGFIHEAVVPQPPPDWQPFGYPLAHVICLVTAYSEGEEGIRTTLDSIATTEYPNSHKTILVVCDGLIKGKGETMTTPDIVLGMMGDYATLPDEVQAFSYVAVASGSKRHNMAKVYAGYYNYGEGSRVSPHNQQRVPMMVIVKTGTPDELKKAKPGNRGKRDSQIILMSFLQKVMFDERMTELEFEMFNGLWKITGISPDFYECVLMVDADTKIFPDSITHMVSAMVRDPEIMGLCGETKIANKRESWVTAIQVFEYFISHHLNKSFESVFGGVSCLPGCFSMYRIKAPKGGQNYWVPILANPDVVEHYSENVVDTLHKKNLLLLGEDRYLSTLMLKTFPKRKQVFVPQAVCKTTVPEKFSVLLSQRRRWINSTVHNLMELVLVRDLCGTFCFSMQFVVFTELIGTLVLPAAITFTFYLIIISIVAKPVPVIPLILLALILGLPAVLIVLTAHRWSYVVWMLIYLLSLPIWNFVLPTYAYWKFDDFSWGETRKTSGEKTKKAGIEYEGEFDSSKITMKKWGDFEKERRLKGPTSSWSRQSQSTSAPSAREWQSQTQSHSYSNSQDRYHMYESDM